MVALSAIRVTYLSIRGSPGNGAVNRLAPVPAQSQGRSELFSHRGLKEERGRPIVQSAGCREYRLPARDPVVSFGNTRGAGSCRNQQLCRTQGLKKLRQKREIWIREENYLFRP